jgi:hypothetical protein
VATAEVKIPDTPFFLQADVGDPLMYYSAADFRRFTGAFMGRTGVLGSIDFRIQQADVVGFAVKIKAGYARVGGDGFDYLVHLTADQTIPLTGFNFNPPSIRWHYVYIAVYDKLYGNSGYEARVVIVEDTGSGGGPAPADAAATLFLGDVNISPGQPNIQNANISNYAQHGGNQGSYVYLDSYLNSAFKSLDAPGFRARYEGGVVRLGGAIARVDDAVFATGATTIGVMHSNLRPKSARLLTATCSIRSPNTTSDGTFTCRLRIDPDGTMIIQMPKENAPKAIGFDGITYDLD